MHYLKEWPRLLLILPNKIRLGLLTLCTIFCLGIHMLTFPILIMVAFWLFPSA